MLAIALLCVANVDDEWLGQTVYPKKPNHELRSSEGKVVGKFSFNAKVVRVDGDWLEVSPFESPSGVFHTARDLRPWRGRVLKSDVVRQRDAKDYFTAHIKAHPDDAWAYFNRSKVRRLTKENEVAIVDMNEAVRLQPTTWNYYWRAVLHFDLKRVDESIADYTEVVRLDPKNAIAFNNRAWAWYVKKNYDAAIADYNDSIRLDPQFALAFNNRGMTWRATQADDKAIADFNEAILLNPKYADAFFNRGTVWSRKNEHDKAIADFDKAIQLSPKDSTAYGGRGKAWYGKKDYDKAIADFSMAIRLRSLNPDVFLNRGLAWTKKKDYDAALEDFDEAIRLGPKNAQAFYSRAAAWKSRNEFDKAIADYNQAIRIDPQYAAAFNNLAWLLATASDEKIRDGKRAVEHATKAVALGEGKTTAWIYYRTLAAAHAEAGDFEAAVKAQRTVIEKVSASKALPAFFLANAETRLKLYQQKKPYRDERSSID